MSVKNEKIEDLGGGIKLVVSPEHNFGTDALLLADFAAPKKRDRACDIGAGCGIIPFLWLRFDAPAHAMGIDIQSKACEQFARSIRINGAQGRLSVVNADIKETKSVLPPGGFDLVTVNPPYKQLDSGGVSRDAAARAARHETECTVYDAAKAAAWLLKYGGRFCLCHRPQRLCDVIEAMRGAGIEPKLLRFVAQRKGMEPWLILVNGKKGANAGLRVMPELLMEDGGGPSDEIKRIYGLYSNRA